MSDEALNLAEEFIFPICKDDNKTVQVIKEHCMDKENWYDVCASNKKKLKK